MSVGIKFMVVTKGHPHRKDGLKVGEVVRVADGWKLFPYTQDGASRKAWPTPKDAAARFKHTELVAVPA